MSPHHVNPVQYAQAVGYARSACARIFRDGGSPVDALRAFHVPEAAAATPGDWAVVVDRIALSLCAAPLRRAA